MIVINQEMNDFRVYCGCKTETELDIDGEPLQITQYACEDHYEDKIKNMKVPKDMKINRLRGIKVED